MDVEIETKSGERSSSPKNNDRSLSPKPRKSGRRSHKSRGSDSTTRRNSRKSHSSSKSPKRSSFLQARIDDPSGSPIRLQGDPIQIGEASMISKKSPRKFSRSSPKRSTSSSRSPKRSRERLVPFDGVVEHDASNSLDASTMLWVAKNHEEMMDLKAIERSRKSSGRKARHSTAGVARRRDREIKEKEKERRYKSKSLSPVPRKRDLSPKRRDLKEKMKANVGSFGGKRDLKEKMKANMGSSGRGMGSSRTSARTREDRAKRQKRRYLVPADLPGAVAVDGENLHAKSKHVALMLDEFDSELWGRAESIAEEPIVVVASTSDGASSAPRDRNHQNTVGDIIGFDIVEQNSTERKRQNAPPNRKYLFVILLLLLLFVAAIVTAVVLLTGQEGSPNATAPTGDTAAPTIAPIVSDSPSASFSSFSPSSAEVCEHPLQQDCSAIENGQSVVGQESMVAKVVFLIWDISLKEGVDMMQEEENVFYKHAQEFLAPSLAGCDLLERRTLMRSRRKVLDASNCVIGNVIVTGRLILDTQCNDEAPLPCFRILTRIELYLKKSVGNLELYGLISTVIDPPNGGPLVQRLQLPDDYAKVEMIQVGGDESGRIESMSPSLQPSLPQSGSPSLSPIMISSKSPTGLGTDLPSESPSSMPSLRPSIALSVGPTTTTTFLPSSGPSRAPTSVPTPAPTANPTTASPTSLASSVPSVASSNSPSSMPTNVSSNTPTGFPTESPTSGPSSSPTAQPTSVPTSGPTFSPTRVPTSGPTSGPTLSPTVPKCLSISRSCGQFVSSVDCQIHGDEISVNVNWCDDGANRAGSENQVRFLSRSGGDRDEYHLKMDDVGGSVELWRFYETCSSYMYGEFCRFALEPTGKTYSSSWVNGIESFTLPSEDIPFAADRYVDHGTMQGYSNDEHISGAPFGDCPIALP